MNTFSSAYCLISLFVCLCITNITAQKVGQISGTIQDSISKNALEFATVSVYQNEQLKGGAISDDKGHFKVSNLPLGTYDVKLDFMGYMSKILTNVTLSDQNNNKNLGEIYLHNASSTLNAAEVVADKATFQLALDKKVFDVEKAGLDQSENATAVLRQTPTVEVDPDGNVKIRGASVQVYINGKPTGLNGESQADILDQIPAANIKNIELITAPSAKYDPEGSSGIINIVLKRNLLKGFTGNVTLSAGTWFNKYRANMGLNYRNSWLNIFSNFSYSTSTRWSKGFVYRETYLLDSTYTIDQTYAGQKVSNNVSGQIGVEFIINKRNSLTVSANWGIRDRIRKDSIQYDFFDYNNSLSQYDKRQSFENGVKQNNSLNLSYRLDFPRAKWPFQHKKDGLKASEAGKKGYGGNKMGEQHQLQIDLQYAQNNRSSLDSFYQQSFTPSVTYLRPPNIQRTKTNDYRPDGMLKIDYTRPYGKDLKFEMGYKGTIRSNRKDFFSETLNSNNDLFEADANLNNDFKYSEQIHAAYLSIGQRIKKLNYQLGLRLEQTYTNANLITTNERFKNNYLSFFPTLNMSYSFNPLNQLQLSYSRRVNRPEAWATNPFPSYRDPLNLRYGNPFLLPSFVNAVELGYANYNKWGSLITSLFYRYNTDLYYRLRFVREDGVSETTYQNLNNSTSYGIEVSGRIKFTKWWSLNSSISIFQQIQDATNIDDSYQSTTITGNISINTRLQLPKNLNINLNFWSSLPESEAQGTNLGYQHSGLNISKGFAKNKVLLTLDVRNPILGGRWISSSFGDNFSVDGKYYWEALIGYLRVTWRFGKLSGKDRSRMRTRGYSGGDSDGGGMGMD